VRRNDGASNYDILYKEADQERRYGSGIRVKQDACARLYGMLNAMAECRAQLRDWAISRGFDKASLSAAIDH
jgi:hypothetical protein